MKNGLKNSIGIGTGVAAVGGALAYSPKVVETATEALGFVDGILEPTLPYAGAAAPFALPLVGGKLAYDIANKYDMNKYAKTCMTAGGAFGGLALASTSLAPYLALGAGVYYGAKIGNGAWKKLRGKKSS